MTSQEIELLLKNKGVKPTANRILVMRQLDAATRPVSLANLEEAILTLDKGSIFRVLELLSANHLIHTIEDGSRSFKYELCRSESHHSLDDDQHVHFHCEKCRQTYCLEHINVPSVELPEGFEATSANFVIKGLCPKCS